MRICDARDMVICDARDMRICDARDMRICDARDRGLHRPGVDACGSSRQTTSELKRRHAAPLVLGDDPVVQGAI